MAFLTCIIVALSVFHFTTGHKAVVDEVTRFALADQFPFVASISCRSNETGARIFCSGSIISHQHVLTAAHCVQRCTSFKIRYDSVTQYTGGKAVVTTSSFIHPDFNPDTMEYDVALIRTNPNAIDPIGMIEPIDSSKNLTIPRDTPIIASGWGRICTNRSPALQFIEAKFPKDVYEVDGIFLGIKFRGSSHERFYESGSPLFVKLDEKWIQVGISTASTTNSNHEGFFANLFNKNIEDFIRETSN